MTINEDPMFASKSGTALPYRGTTGASGSETSRTRAEREAADGTAAQRQRRIVDLLEESGSLGMTWKEIADKTGQHHGQVSGALSSMHKEGVVAALKLDRRNGCGVYVMPNHVVGRITRPFNENKARETVAAPVAEAPKRPRLSADEVALAARIRAGVNQSNDQPFIRVKPESMRTLLNALDRLNK